MQPDHLDSVLSPMTGYLDDLRQVFSLLCASVSPVNTEDSSCACLVYTCCKDQAD